MKPQDVVEASKVIAKLEKAQRMMRAMSESSGIKGLSNLTAMFPSFVWIPGQSKSEFELQHVLHDDDFGVGERSLAASLQSLICDRLKEQIRQYRLSLDLLGVELEDWIDPREKAVE